MSFYVFTASDGTHYRHDDQPVAVSVFDAKMKSQSAVLRVENDSFDGAAHLGSNLFAIGYWSGHDLSLHDLKSGERRETFPFRKIGPIACFSDSGSHLLFKSGSSVVLLDLINSEPIPIHGVASLDRLIVIGNRVVVPSQRKDELLIVSLHDGQTVSRAIPFNATVFDLKRNPIANSIVAIDKKKVVHCIDLESWSLVWSTSLKKNVGKGHVGVGQFSGDGSLFGAAVSANSGNYTIVLDSTTGNVVNSIEGICYGLPHVGTMVRDSSTQKGTMDAETLDLASGCTGTVTLCDASGITK